MTAPVVVVTGPPGAGKSTVCELVVQRYAPSALVTGDDFFAFLRAGRIDPWLPESHAQNEVVVEAAAAAAGRLATGGITVIYDGVIGPWLRDDDRHRIPVAAVDRPDRLADRVAAALVTGTLLV